MWTDKSLHNAFYRYASLNGRGVIDVQIVVEVNEIVTDCLTEHGQAHSGKEQVYNDSYATTANASWGYASAAVNLPLLVIRCVVPDCHLLN